MLTRQTSARLYDSDVARAQSEVVLLANQPLNPICTCKSSCRRLATIPGGQSSKVMTPDHLSYHLPHYGVARRQHRVVANECQRDATLTK